MSRFNRTNFFPTENVDGQAERDLVKNYFNDYFEIRHQMRFYIVEAADLLRPDVLSIKFYGKQDYWWIVCRVNKIDDVWNDLASGDVIQVPDIQDINDFYATAKKQMKAVE